ncbi:MAG: formylglycine-generating enzyme family protein [Deltaproteobacteria bacterium]|nr:formylglycine-generating enzyme family protein [Deltaproteobacteria bacterium]
MVRIPAGVYRPFFPQPDGPTEVPVPAFLLAEHAVTNAAFLEFVRANPRWRRSRVARIFADERYLSHWRGDLEPGPGLADRPVTFVSWFAARAYASWAGRRLPTQAEWERAAAASETRDDGRDEPGVRERILAWYGRPSSPLPPPIRSTRANLWGVSDLHGVIWEWVEDFNSVLLQGDARGDGKPGAGLFCGAGTLGSADPSDYAAFMRFAMRSSLRGAYTMANLGFRCAGDAPTPHPGGER